MKTYTFFNSKKQVIATVKARNYQVALNKTKLVPQTPYEEV